MPNRRSDVVASNVLIDEMRYILETLCERVRTGDRLRLGDARSMLKSNLTLDFADYFKFLKRYNYVVINRSDQTLAVTEEGRTVAEKGGDSEFVKELNKHFGDRLSPAEEELIEMDDEDAFRTPPREPAARPVKSRPSDAGKKSEPMSVSKGSKYDSKYTRYDPIGSGGIGTVFKGRHNALALDVALKEIKDLFTYFNFLQRSEVVRNLKDVVGMMATLRHPLIVEIIDQNVEVAHPYFVMEYLPSGNLKELMQASPLPIDRCLTLFTQICYALRAAHAGDMIHGNLKPENVLLDEYNNVRVTDFGMTRLLHTDSDRSVPQVVTGSLGYLSPEQMQQRSIQTVAADIYSLGILFYEMLTGNLPGRRSPLPSEVNAEIPKDIDDLFDRMTRDDPADRYPDLDALLNDFYQHFKDGQFLSKGKLILFSDPAGASGGSSQADS